MLPPTKGVPLHLPRRLVERGGEVGLGGGSAGRGGGGGEKGADQGGGLERTYSAIYGGSRNREGGVNRPERERDRQRDRQTDRQTDTDTERK